MSCKESSRDTLFLLLTVFSYREKTHKKCPCYFVMYGELYMPRGMTGTSAKNVKNVKNIAKKR